VTAEGIYRWILERLSDLGADMPAQQIERNVARGFVAPNEVVAEKHKKAERVKVVATMSSRDSLLVALEFLVAVSEVPPMVDHVRDTLECIEASGGLAG
jgi:hypothetical protein